jgi:hypothetical protein
VVDRSGSCGGARGDLLAPRLAASNIIENTLKGIEGGTTSATLGSQQHRWPHAWSRAPMGYF